MESTLLSNTDIKIPKLSLGTMTFGGQTSEKESCRIMDYAFEQNMNFFDTANIYNEGRSEEIIGRWLQSKRSQITLATKVGYLGGGLKGVNLSAAAIQEGLEASLKRLQTDYVDIYYLHAPDLSTGIEESLEMMNELVESGRVHHIGISNYAAWQMADILAVCEREGFVKPVITQNVYNLITRAIETELIPFLDVHPMGLTVYNPIAAGLLTGKHRKRKALEGTRMSDNTIYRGRYWTEANLNTVEKLSKLADERDISMLQLAMKWCISQPKVTSILTGVSCLEQLEQNVAAIEGEGLDQEILEACNLIWKAHTGNPFGYNR